VVLRAADRLADALFQLAMETGVTVFPVAQAREALRRALGTWPLDDFGQPRDFDHAESRARSASLDEDSAYSLPSDRLSRIAAEAADLDGQLYLGFTDAPFVLLLQPDDIGRAAEFLRAIHQSRRESAELVFGGRSPEVGEWVLTTMNRTLSFRMALPPEFEPVILGRDRDFNPEGYKNGPIE
jgi:hypothetical protein